MIQLKVFTDIICPWCWIGKQRLETAVSDLQIADRIAVEWLPFILNPPIEGMDRRIYRSAKFGSWEKSLEMDRHVAAVGDEAGLKFRFDRQNRTPNTELAHRLVWFAGRLGRQNGGR